MGTESERTSPDVAIVGASVAGLAAAVALVKAGVSVALLDARVRPSDRACGEGLSSAGADELDRLVPGVSSAGRPFFGFDVGGFAEGSPGGVRFTGIPGKRGVGVGRAALERLLLAEGRRHPGWLYRPGVTATAIVPASPGATSRHVVITRDGGRFGCAAVIVADGSRSPSARATGFRLHRYGTERFGVTLRYDGTFEPGAPDTVAIVVARGFELYLTRTGAGGLNVSAVATAAAAAEAASAVADEALLAPLFRDRGFRGRPAAPIRGAGPFCRFRRPASRGGIFLVGDALEAFDPAGGMGMTHAAVSARLAAAAVTRLLSGREGDAGYDADVRAASARLRGYTTAAAFSVRAGIVTTGLVPRPVVGALAARLAGALEVGRGGVTGRLLDVAGRVVEARAGGRPDPGRRADYPRHPERTQCPDPPGAP